MPRKIYLLIFCFYTINANFYKSNFTDFNKCRVHYSRTGSVYKDFYEISEEPRNNGSLLDFHFSVLASSDAHILLAPSANVEKADPVYEIVIGAGGNTFCDIRRMQKSAVKASVRIKGLLSALDIQSFWIHIGKDGVIDVGQEGEDLAFISWIDPDPLPLKVFSFSTWPGVEAKWFFDCPRDNATGHSKEIQKNLTFVEKLRRDLIYNYDPYIRPVKNNSDITAVTLTMRTDFANLDEHASTLQFNARIRLNWIDEKLKWNASNYGGLDTLYIFRREIWVPNLYCFNSVEHDSDILEDSLITINSTGFINWQPSMKIKSWCSPDDLGNWPRDTHMCDLLLGFWRDFEHLQLIFNSNNSVFSFPYLSNWKIMEVESISNIGWLNYPVSDSRDFDPPSLTLQFKLKRISNSYTIILFTPFFVLAVSLLATFAVSPFGYLKMSLACFQLTLSAIILLGLGLLIPIHSKFVPNLVSLYSYSLVASLFCVIVTIIVINLSRNQKKYSPPHCVTRIITSCFLKWLLCLPNTKTSEEYGNLNESTIKLNENQQTLWILIGIAIDRIAFAVYLVLIIYAFCITY